VPHPEVYAYDDKGNAYLNRALCGRVTSADLPCVPLYALNEMTVDLDN